MYKKFDWRCRVLSLCTFVILMAATYGRRKAKRERRGSHCRCLSLRERGGEGPKKTTAKNFGPLPICIFPKRKQCRSTYVLSKKTIYFRNPIHKNFLIQTFPSLYELSAVEEGRGQCISLASIEIYFRMRFSGIVSSWTLPSPPWDQAKYTVCIFCIQYVIVRGLLGCVGDHILRNFTLNTWPNLGIKKIAWPPQKKNLGGGSLRQINSCRKVLFRLLLRRRDFALPHIWVLSFYSVEDPRVFYIHMKCI